MSRYSTSHLFVMPSKWEGFPNALAEALAHGLPAVGYCECAGVADLIKPGKNGLLADGNGDVEALAQTLKKLMADPDLRVAMGTAAVNSVKAGSAQAIYPRWENLI